MRDGDFTHAADVIERMLMFAPNQADLWNDAATCHARLGNLGAAIRALERFLPLCDGDSARHAAAARLQRLRARLN